MCRDIFGEKTCCSIIWKEPSRPSDLIESPNTVICCRQKLANSNAKVKKDERDKETPKCKIDSGMLAMSSEIGQKRGPFFHPRLLFSSTILFSFDCPAALLSAPYRISHTSVLQLVLCISSDRHDTWWGENAHEQYCLTSSAWPSIV